MIDSRVVRSRRDRDQQRQVARRPWRLALDAGRHRASEPAPSNRWGRNRAGTTQRWRSLGVAESDERDEHPATIATDQRTAGVLHPGMRAQFLGDVFRNAKADSRRLPGTLQQRLKHKCRGQAGCEWDSRRRRANRPCNPIRPQAIGRVEQWSRGCQRLQRPRYLAEEKSSARR